MAEKLNTEPSDSEYESEFDEDDEIRLSEPSENAVYNREGLLDKLGDISWPENVEWIHKLSLDVNQEQEVDVNDDLTREHAFYTQALEGTKDAFLKLKSVGRPFIKPCDYNNAPMVKNDTHMEKVKDQLLAEKNRIDESEERRKIREKEKIAKEVQAQKLKEKAKQEKEERKSVEKGRKQISLSELAEDDDMESDSEDGNTLERSNDKRQMGSPGDHSGGQANNATGKGKKEKDKKRKNRDYRNSKNGIGGKKGMKKQNRAETTNSGFSKNKRRKV